MILNLPYNMVQVMLYYYYIYKYITMMLVSNVIMRYIFVLISVIIEDKLNFLINSIYR